jgi:uncharacterized membrane protein YecN with MAPEG domain
MSKRPPGTVFADRRLCEGAPITDFSPVATRSSPPQEREIDKGENEPMILQTTLCLAAAAAVITFWHIARIAQLRMRDKVLFGDGGNDLLSRRMRAQLNFVESTPFVLILVAAIEITGKAGPWLAIVGALFMLGRVAHALGMDIPRPNPLRIASVVITVLTLLGLSVIALLIALGRF